MSEAYLLDTNIVSAFLKFPKLVAAPSVRPERTKLVLERVGQLASPTFSALTVWEIERGLAKEGMKRHLRSFRTLCLRSTVLPIDQSILDLAVEVWAATARAGKRPGDIDCLLVATARRWGYTFVSGDLGALACAANQSPPVPAQNWFEDL